VKWYLSEVPIVELLVSNGLVTSKGAAKRLLRDHAIKVDDVTVETDTVLLVEGNVIRVGKRRYLRIVE
jgi:tyrosyl-tRNA synthetase